jgi:hypothetical protein
MRNTLSSLEILLRNQFLDANGVKPESGLTKDLGADLLSLLEDEFEIDVDDEVAR